MAEASNICIYCIKKIDSKDLYNPEQLDFAFHKQCYIIYLQRNDINIFIIFSISIFVAIMTIVILLEITFL